MPLTLVAVCLALGFLGGLTGILFGEFALALGGIERRIGELAFLEFLGPGLIMMAIVQGGLIRFVLRWFGERGTVVYGHVFDLIVFMAFAQRTPDFEQTLLHMFIS